MSCHDGYRWPCAVSDCPAQVLSRAKKGSVASVVFSVADLLRLVTMRILVVAEGLIWKLESLMSPRDPILDTCPVVELVYTHA